MAKKDLFTRDIPTARKPTDDVLAIGSGGPYALAAARALMAHTQMKPGEIVRHGLEIAGDICIYTNRQIEVVELS